MQVKPTKVLNEKQLESISSNINKEELNERLERLERQVFKKLSFEQTRNKKQVTRKKDYKTPIKEILSATSLQFLLSSIRTKRILIKIINSCFLIISVYITISLIVSNITQFLMYETTTSISTINEKKPEFPIVSFCSIGKLSYKFTLFRFNNINLTDEWLNYFEAFNDASYGKCYRFNSGTNITNHSVLIQKSKRSGYNDEFNLELKLDVNSFIVSIYNQSQKQLFLIEAFIFQLEVGIIFALKEFMIQN